LIKKSELALTALVGDSVSFNSSGNHFLNVQGKVVPIVVLRERRGRLRQCSVDKIVIRHVSWSSKIVFRSKDSILVPADELQDVLLQHFQQVSTQFETMLCVFKHVQKTINEGATDKA